MLTMPQIYTAFYRKKKVPVGVEKAVTEALGDRVQTLLTALEGMKFNQHENFASHINDLQTWKKNKDQDEKFYQAYGLQMAFSSYYQALALMQDGSVTTADGKPLAESCTSENMKVLFVEWKKHLKGPVDAAIAAAHATPFIDEDSVTAETTATKDTATVAQKATASALPLYRKPLFMGAVSFLLASAITVVAIAAIIATGDATVSAFLAKLSLNAMLSIAAAGVGPGLIAGFAVAGYNSNKEYQAKNADLGVITAKSDVEMQVKPVATTPTVVVASAPVVTNEQAPVAKTRFFSMPKFMTNLGQKKNTPAIPTELGQKKKTPAIPTDAIDNKNGTFSVDF